MAPSGAPLKACSKVSPSVGCTLKTVPQSYSALGPWPGNGGAMMMHSIPPATVVPYILPAASRTRSPAGLAPSGSPVKLYSTLSVPVVSNSNTTPQVSVVMILPRLGSLQGPAPPANAVPYILPSASKTKPPIGVDPSSPPLKLYWTLSLPVASSLNTVPLPEIPPADVVPNRLPAASRTRSAAGPAPSGDPVKLYSTVSVPVASSLKTVPEFVVPPCDVVP